MSDTPRTDRQVQADEDDDPPMLVHVEFARDLERESCRAHEVIITLERNLSAARGRIAELEAERDMSNERLDEVDIELGLIKAERDAMRTRIADLEIERDHVHIPRPL